MECLPLCATPRVNSVKMLSSILAFENGPDRIPAMMLGAFTRPIVSGLAMMTLASSCAPPAHVVGVKCSEPGVMVEEVRVTGRPIPGVDDLVPDFEIEGFNRPDGKPYAIHVPVSSELDLTKQLDPRKIYSVVFYLQEYKQPDGTVFYDATLSRVEDNGTVILDSSICDVHRCAMSFVEGNTLSYGFEFEKENRDLESFHNHGYHIIRGNAFGRDRVWNWRCPKCAEKVDAFRSKIDSP